MSLILQAIDKAFTKVNFPNHQFLIANDDGELYLDPYIGVWPTHITPDQGTPFLAILEHQISTGSPDQLRLLTYGDLWSKQTRWRAPPGTTPIIPSCKVSYFHPADPDLLQRLLVLLTILQARIPKNTPIPKTPTTP